MYADKHLFSSNPVLGRFLRNRAVERLFSAESREAAVALAGAVAAAHPEAEAIFNRLVDLRHNRNPVMHTALWNYWKAHRFEELLNRVESSGAHRLAMMQTLEAMPQSDWGNGVLFALWRRLDCADLAAMLEAQGRHAPALEMDALFGLVRGKPERYLKLEDPDYSIFEKAWLAASAAQRQRVSMTVLQSQQPRLIAAYDKAVKEERDPQLIIEAFKLCGEHDALFDRLEGLPFNGALEVIAFWAESGGRPKAPAKASLVEQIVALYGEVAEQLPESRPSALPGTREIFSFWTERYQTDDAVRQDLSSPDPFKRAGALYCGVQRELVAHSQLREAGWNGTWPEKLAVQYLFNAPESGARNEHVAWLRPQDNVVAAILSMRLPGTLEESSRLADQLQNVSRENYQHKLLRLLTLLQSHFLRGLITVDSSDDAAETNAVETEEAGDVEW